MVRVATFVKIAGGLTLLAFRAAAHADTMFVANAGNNTVQRFDGSGSGNGTVFASSGFREPIGLALDDGGNLYVSDFANNTIEKVNANGNESLFATAGLSEPKGMAFDNSGNLYVANFGSSTIEKFNPNGHGTVFASTGLNGPYGIAFSPLTGDLYAANNNGTI